MHELIGDITLSILFAWVLGLLAHFFRQPLILAYLIAGFLIGPFGMGLVKSQESISIISELGLIFMLFMIGLEIDLKKIVRAGRVILFAAGGQLVGGCLLGILFFVGDRAADGRRRLRCAVSLHRLRAEQHRHHRQGAVRETRARHAARPHHARRAGAAGYLRHPVSGGAAQPRQSPGQRDPALDRPRRRAGGDGPDTEPLCAAEAVSPDRAPPGTDPARRAGVVLPDRRDRREAASVARNGIAGGRRLAVDIPLCARRHRQGHDAARFLHHAVLRRIGHDDPDPEPVGDRACADDRGLHGGQPRGDDVRAALSDEAGPARQPAAGDQSGADQRVFAGGDPDRHCGGSYPDPRPRMRLLSHS